MFEISLQPILEASDLSVVFDVLNSSDADVISVGCKVVGDVLDLIDPKILLSRFVSSVTQMPFQPICLPLGGLSNSQPSSEV